MERLPVTGLLVIVFQVKNNGITLTHLMKRK
jgi:hypothetical protein